MREINLKLKNNSYNIYIRRNILKDIGKILKNTTKTKKIAIITDKNLEAIYMKEFKETLLKDGYDIKVISIEPGEKSKTLKTVESIYCELSDFNITRGDLILTFGGGVVGDLGGFVASTYLRGVPYVQVPTSLLAQVDSSIGGKVGVDLSFGKNLVGSFYHPKAVIIDPMVLNTLNRRYLNDGLGEVIKYGCIKDESIISNLLEFKNHTELLDNIEEIIYKCLDIKKTFVQNDEFDHGDRMILNFGHTLGHAIEKYFDFQKYSHGEAVAIGMAQISKNCEKLKITKEGTTKTIINVLSKYDLPHEKPSMDDDNILNTIMLDKKRNGDFLNIILIKKIGEGFIQKIKKDEVYKYFK